MDEALQFALMAPKRRIMLSKAEQSFLEQCYQERPEQWNAAMTKSIADRLGVPRKKVT